MRLILAAMMLALTAIPSHSQARPYNNGFNYNQAHPEFARGKNVQRRAIVPHRAQRGKRVVQVRRGNRVVTRYAAPQRQAAQRQPIASRLSPSVASTPIAAARNVVSQAGRIATQILPHPAGCPRTLFCGCGAAVEIFGAPLRSLWHTSAWMRMPRAAPAPGMAVVRPGHVFVIRQVLGNNMVLAYDANSGGGKTRLHVRSIAGWRVVNPRA